MNAVKAAILAPANNMLRIEDFESSFDTVKFHLEIALGHAGTMGETMTVQQLTQQLFDFYSKLVTQLIAKAKEGNIEPFLASIRSDQSFAELAKTYRLDYCAAIVALDTLKNSVIGFVQKLFRDQELKNKSAKFYHQVARSYSKIIRSAIYADKYDLLKNIIERQTIEIVNGIIALREWEDGIDFIVLLRNRHPPDLAARAEKALVEGYRKSLATGLKFVARAVKYTYIYILVSMALFFSLLLLAFSGGGDGSGFLFLLMFIASILLMRYFWRFGPDVAKFRSKINQRAQKSKP